MDMSIDLQLAYHRYLSHVCITRMYERYVVRRIGYLDRVRRIRVMKLQMEMHVDRLQVEMHVDRLQVLSYHMPIDL